MSTEPDDIVARITEIVAAELGVPAEGLAPETDLRGIEGADSVRLLRVVAKVEQVWDVELDDADVFGVSSVADLSAVVASALQVKA
ncbi:Acyl carrier protein [Frankia canadensis]|uniref:Acyl carrier protein n=1 Tax=Frankia canadensis TaxID=1836972 RepID=A0A2I2KNF2_9ACTN|nr:acyl carrier protein [Frankia canadensis]SNQ47195.1 Acyl carrier protein [Frankia canadensis]SOU54485.1 Acyl carrier protein [Frankia canadensis]